MDEEQDPLADCASYELYVQKYARSIAEDAIEAGSPYYECLDEATDGDQYVHSYADAPRLLAVTSNKDALFDRADEYATKPGRSRHSRNNEGLEWYQHILGAAHWLCESVDGFLCRAAGAALVADVKDAIYHLDEDTLLEIAFETKRNEAAWWNQHWYDAARSLQDEEQNYGEDVADEPLPMRWTYAVEHIQEIAQDKLLDDLVENIEAADFNPDSSFEPDPDNLDGFRESIVPSWQKSATWGVSPDLQTAMEVAIGVWWRVLDGWEVNGVPVEGEPPWEDWDPATRQFVALIPGGARTAGPTPVDVIAALAELHKP